MTSILAPLTNFLKRPTNVPSGNLTVDHTHPLAFGLLACWIPGISHGNNLAYPGFTDLNTSVAGQSPSYNGNTIDGPGMLTSQSGSINGISTGATGAFLNITNASIFWRGMVTGTVTNNGVLVAIVPNTTGATPFTVLELFQQSGGTTALTLGWNDGGTFVGSANQTLTLNTPFSGGGSFTSPNGSALAYFNGQQFSSSAVTASPTYGTGPNVSLNAVSTDTGTQPTAICNIACFWNRSLSAKEQLAMHLAPYDFIISQEYELPVTFFPAIDGSGASPGVTRRFRRHGVDTWNQV